MKAEFIPIREQYDTFASKLQSRLISYLNMRFAIDSPIKLKINTIRLNSTTELHFR
jgi:hypothetical protein